MPIPTLFVSHGAPTLALEHGPAATFFAGLPARIPRPEAIVVVSAHWETGHPAVTGSASPETIHDFYGFPAPLYDLVYPAPGDPALAGRVREMLGALDASAAVDPHRGLDHGAWQFLRLMWPEASIPVLQVSLRAGRGPAEHYALGRALSALADLGVLVIGSGGITHNLREFRGAAADTPAPPWVDAFADWVAERLTAGDDEALLDYRRQGPEAARNHPTEDHLLPLFVAMGAAGAARRATRLHRSTSYRVLRMDAWAFEAV